MGIEKIENKIRDAGQREMEEIKRNAEKEIRKIENEINEEALKAYREVKEKRKQELILMPRRIVSDAVMEKKKRTEEKRIEFVYRAFDTAKDRILSMDKETKKKILKNLAEEGKRHAKNPLLYVDKNYSDLITATAKNIGDFGVVVESEDKTLIIDNTLNNVMKRIEPNLKPRLAKILFGEN